MNMQKHWPSVFLLAILVLSLQSCLASPFQNEDAGKNGQIGVNGTAQAQFTGKIYFTLTMTSTCWMEISSSPS